LKTLTLILTLLGLLIITGLTAWEGVGPVIETVRHVGLGGFALMLAVQLTIDAGLGTAWRAACPNLALPRLIVARAVRDAAGSCLPFSQLGGIVFGIRATVGKETGGKESSRHPQVPWPEAVSANIVDITTELLGQIVFVLLALVFLIGHEGASRFVWPVLGGMVLLALGVTGFIWTQQRGGATIRKLSQFLGKHIAQEWRDSLIDNMDVFQEHMDALWSRPARIALGATAHLLCWIGSAFMAWLCYRLLGAHLPFAGAIAIEGVECGIMSASFLVPSSLGVQEVGYVALGMIFGIDPKISLGLSLLRRARDLSLGIPILVAWQGFEALGLRRRKPRPHTQTYPESQTSRPAP